MRRDLLSLFLVSFLLVIGGGCAEAENETEPAAQAWPEIERTHAPWTRWWWMGNAVDEETLSQLLATYDEAGIGGVEITPIYGVRGYEEAFIDYLSPTWMTLLHHTVREAEALGMGVDMATGTGWPFGGPNIPLEQAARRLVTRTYRLQAGERLADPLTVQSEPVDARAPLRTLMAYSDEGTIRNLTDRVDADGRLDWEAPSGTWTLYALFGGWTGKQVERAAPGGAGYVIDHFSEEALQTHLTRFDQAFSEHDRPAIRAFFNDSYEVEGADWTPAFLDAFERHQGYDLRYHLPAFIGEASDDKAARVYTDYRETLDSLLLNAFTRPWTEWTHEQGGQSRNQAHGSPANLLDLYAAVDMPETETFHASRFDIPGLRTDSMLIAMGENASQPDPLVFKLASSGGHVAGHNLISSETATWLGEHFRVSLAQIKPEVDQLFTAGINHVFFHGTPYSPPDARWPGWLFYASTHVAPTNTFWRDLPGLTSYIARCQSFLQAGAPDNDVLLYVPFRDRWQQGDGAAFQLSIHNPEEWFYDTPAHQAAQLMQDRGYTFDYVSDRLLHTMEGSEAGVQADGGQYEVIVLSAPRYMSAGTFEHLTELVRSGATVVAHGGLPQDVPGWGDVAARRQRLQALREALSFASTATDGVRAASVGAGRFLAGDDLTALLQEAGVQREPMADRGLAFTRRQHERGHHYFLANLGADPIEGWLPLGTETASAVLFDPMTTQSGVAAVRRADEGAEVYVQLEPGASRILRTFTTDHADGPNWTYLRDDGTPHELGGQWTVQFVDGGPVLPDSFSTRSLASWTTLGGEEAQRFAGTAQYTLTFDAPSDSAAAWTLDLGRVRESARVTLNGHDLGRVWAHPFTRRVEDALQSGTNRLEIEVTNLAANRIADMDRRGVEWKTFYDINLVGLDYRPFDASGWSPVASGLLGPVTLVPGTEIHPGDRP